MCETRERDCYDMWVMSTNVTPTLKEILSNDFFFLQCSLTFRYIHLGCRRKYCITMQGPFQVVGQALS